jgi:hypothetical protein
MDSSLRRLICFAAVVAIAAGKTARLSSARRMLTATNVGGWSLFAGGFLGKQASDAVDIFDAEGTFVRTERLSQARGLISSTSWGDTAFFAGGQIYGGNKSAVVDIFNITSGKWTTSQLTIGRSMLTAMSVGDLVIFAGGELKEQEGNTSKTDDTDRVDILNMKSGKWSTAALCVPRKKLSSTVVGDKAIIAGGYLSGGGGSRAEWDMLDASTGTWTAGNLSVSRMRMQAASAGGLAFFVSGMGDTCGSNCPMVDVYNSSSSRWGTTALSRGR